MANTFKGDTKTNVVTDAVSSTNTNVVTCGGSAAPYSPNGTNQMAFITIAVSFIS